MFVYVCVCMYMCVCVHVCACAIEKGQTSAAVTMERIRLPLVPTRIIFWPFDWTRIVCSTRSVPSSRISQFAHTCTQDKLVTKYQRSLPPSEFFLACLSV